MNFNPEQLKEFNELYKKEFGYEITDEKAIEYASQLINLLVAVYK